MLKMILMAFLLMAACVVLHATGLALAMRRLERSLASLGGTYWPRLRLLVAVAGMTVLVHLLEITVWAVYYAVGGGMPDLDSALYFSAVTYTTTGYGDLVLPERWRLVGGVEALTGILMCGWSTGFFFAVVNQIFIRNAEPAPPRRSSAHAVAPPAGAGGTGGRSPPRARAGAPAPRTSAPAARSWPPWGRARSSAR